MSDFSAWGSDAPRRRSALVVTMILALVILVGVPAAIVFSTRGSDHPAAWDPRVAELAEFVEAQRDLAFDHPVEVELLAADDYADRTRMDEADITDESREEMESRVAMLRSLGLASGDVDLVEAGNDMADTGTLAFYDPVSEQVVVRGTELTPGLRATLVHELTHVLQDQHFDLQQRLTLDDEAPADRDEEARREAFTSLIEGDAVRIENAYVDQLPADELDEYRSSYEAALSRAEEGLSEVPAALQAFQAVPYALGHPLVELLVAEGGNPAVDAAFADPPSTGEHMLDPLAFFNREAPTELDRPDLPAGARRLDEGVFGAVDLYLMLAERIDPLVALEAADGWGNAQFIWFEDEDEEEACVRIAVDGDTPGDDRELRAALDTWVDAAPAATDAAVTERDGGATQIESCDPGQGADIGDGRALDTIALPAIRAEIALLGAQRDGARVEDAWASGDCFIRQFGFDQLVALNADTSGGLEPAVTDALAECGV